VKEDKAVTDYWLKHYVVSGRCGLCLNSGTIKLSGRPSSGEVMTIKFDLKKPGLVVDKAVTDYWLKHYVVSGRCGLCLNSGTIKLSGRPSCFCFCPNGQLARSLDAQLRRSYDHQARP
jgi:hypothetical protein